MQVHSFTIRAAVTTSGDYDNDGKMDLAIYRGATWYVKRSANNSYLIKDFGLGTDVHVPAAYLRQ